VEDLDENPLLCDVDIVASLKKTPSASQAPTDDTVNSLLRLLLLPLCATNTTTTRFFKDSRRRESLLIVARFLILRIIAQSSS
jgi:hypothetical protein